MKRQRHTCGISRTEMQTQASLDVTENKQRQPVNADIETGIYRRFRSGEIERTKRLIEAACDVFFAKRRMASGKHK